MRQAIQIGCLGAMVLAGATRSVSAAGTPVGLTGWTTDDIVGKAETGAVSDGNVNGWNFYEPGLTSGTQGLPVDSNRMLTTAGGTTFQLAPYAGKNTAFVNNGAPVTLSLTTPASFSSLSFLDIDGNGFPTTWNVTLNFHGGSATAIANYNDSDWTQGATDGSSAFTNYGLVTQGNTSNFYTGFLAAYEHDYTLSADDAAKTLDSITLTNTNGGTLMFLGVSGVPEPASATLVAVASLALLGRRRSRR